MLQIIYPNYRIKWLKCSNGVAMLICDNITCKTDKAEKVYDLNIVILINLPFSVESVIWNTLINQEIGSPHDILTRTWCSLSQGLNSLYPKLDTIYCPGVSLINHTSSIEHPKEAEKWFNSQFLSLSISIEIRNRGEGSIEDMW